MDNRANKFLIVNHELILGKVEYHRELMMDGTKKQDIIGGGRFAVNQEQKELLFYGSSDDFGTVTIKDMQTAIQSTKLSKFVGYKAYFSSSEWYSKAQETKIKVGDL